MLMRKVIIMMVKTINTTHSNRVRRIVCSRKLIIMMTVTTHIKLTSHQSTIMMIKILTIITNI